jgi:hypothetical protein
LSFAKRRKEQTQWQAFRKSWTILKESSSQELRRTTRRTHEVIEKMHRATAELKATGIEDRALKVGDRAPSFTLFNQDHVQVSSIDLLREGPLVVSFFRGHW